MKLQVFLFLLLSSCSLSKLQKSGTVEPIDFYTKQSFETYKGVMGIRAELDGESKVFLFDTGADLNLVQRDSISGKTTKYSGASNRKMELGKEQVASLKIGNVEFKDTYAVTGDMLGLKEQIPDFGGLIGQSVIHKANWLIDYPGRQVEISNRDLADDSYRAIDIKRKNGNNPYTNLTFNGQDYEVVIDFGSSSVINLPEDSGFGKAVAAAIELKENTRDRYTLGGLQQVTEKVGVIPEIKLGNLTFTNVEVNLNTSSQPRIGIRFFEDYMIYIDNLREETFKLKKSQR